MELVILGIMDKPIGGDIMSPKRNSKEEQYMSSPAIPASEKEIISDAVTELREIGAQIERENPGFLTDDSLDSLVKAARRLIRR